MIAGWPGPADRLGVASGRFAVRARGRRALARALAPAPPLTLTRCSRAPRSVRVGRISTAVVPPVHIGSPTCRSIGGRASGPCVLGPAETQLLQWPSSPRNRRRIPAPAGSRHSRPTRSAGCASSTVVPPSASDPSQRWARAGDGGAPSSASAARGGRSALAPTAAEATSSDLRVKRRALIHLSLTRVDRERRGSVNESLLNQPARERPMVDGRGEVVVPKRH